MKHKRRVEPMYKAILFAILSITASIMSGTAFDARAQGKPENPIKQPRWEPETGCAGHGAVALQALKKAVFEAPAFPHPPENYLKCDEALVIPVQAYSPYSVVQIRNNHFCQGNRCLTYLFDHRKEIILLSVAADDDIRIIVSRDLLIDVLRPFYNHKVENMYNVIGLKLSGGRMIVSPGFGELPMIEFVRSE